MKKFLLFAFAAVMLGFAGCNDDENKDNTPPTLREYEAPVFMYGKTREEVKASVPYAYSGASETSLYFEGKGIVKEYIYIFEDNKVYSCGRQRSQSCDEHRRQYLLRSGGRRNGEDALRTLRKGLAEAAEHNHQPQRQVHIHQYADGFAHPALENLLSDAGYVCRLRGRYVR